MRTEITHRTNLPFSKNAAKFLWLCCMICFSVGNVACQSSKELSRAKAQALIVQDAEFKDPRVLLLTRTSVDGKGIFWILKQPASEEREQAQARVLPSFFKYSPQHHAALHLGMIDAEATLVREDTKVSPIDKPAWGFKITLKPTDAARALAEEMKLPASETQIPTGLKKFVAVTGITKLAENQAKADFTWTWVPNRLGRALDPSTSEFKALPKELQSVLLDEANNGLQPQIEDWTGERKLSGLFQRYDDGWRLVRFW